VSWGWISLLVAGLDGCQLTLKGFPTVTVNSVRTGQPSGAALPPGQKVPAAHALATALPAGQKLPAGQAVATALPAGQKLPAGQGVGAAALAPQRLPAGQGRGFGSKHL